MEIGFIGLGSMGGPMSRRLVEAGHKLTVFDTRKEAMEPLIKLGAEAARSPADVADRVETILTSLPSLDIGMKVVSGDDGLIRGNRVRRYVDLSTTGSRAAIKTAEITAPGFKHDVFSAWHPLWVGGSAHAQLGDDWRGTGSNT